jgi:glycosyltransferase involved in cell wall biosynthesis
MNILHLTTFLQGGAGRVITELARTQHDDGHRVTVVTSKTGAPGYGNYPAYLEQLRTAGLTVEEVDSMFARDYSANLAVVQRIAEVMPINPDVIHAHAAVPSLVGLLVGAMRRRPIGVLQTMHGWGIAKTPGQAAMDVRLMQMVERVAVPSRHAMDQLRQFGVPASRITIVPYGVGPAAVRLDEMDLQLRQEMLAARRAGTLVVVCVGTIVPRKNQRLLLEAIAQLDASVPALAVLIGDGDARDLHRHRLAAELDIVDRVRVRGYSPAARVIAASADAMVLPSRSEGQPLAILEAFADQILTITSDVPELVELVEDGVTGFTFAAENASALASTLERVARLPEASRQAIRAAGQELHAQRFASSTMARRYYDLYRDVISSSESTRRSAA